MREIVIVVEVLGVAFIVGGIALGVVKGASDLVARRGGSCAYDSMRRYLGRSILLGLEVLVAADLIRTVAVEPNLQNVVTLAIIVLIRTFLSFSLEVELEGVLPWRRRQVAATPLPERSSS
jgi:uncharacterized membrane protein